MNEDSLGAIDPQLAQSVIVKSVGARNLPEANIADATAIGNEVTVTLTMSVDYIFAKAVGLDGIDLTATGSASLE